MIPLQALQAENKNCTLIRLSVLCTVNLVAVRPTNSKQVVQPGMRVYAYVTWLE
jgi:hypothetical protein